MLLSVISISIFRKHHSKENNVDTPPILSLIMFTYWSFISFTNWCFKTLQLQIAAVLICLFLSCVEPWMTRINFSSFCTWLAKWLWIKMKLTLETAKQDNLLIEAWWPHKKRTKAKFSWPTLHDVSWVSLAAYEINEFPVTWLFVLLAVWTYGQSSCTSQQTESMTLPLGVSKSHHQQKYVHS